MAAVAQTIYAVTLTTQNTEYSQALPTDARIVKVKCRTAVDIRVSWVTNKVATPTDPYWTIKSGTTETIEVPQNLSGGSQTLYLAAGTGSVVAEILVLS